MNGQREPRDAGGDDDADWRTVRDDYAPVAGAPEARCSAPAVRRDPS